MPLLVARLTHSLVVLAFVATIGFVLVRLVGDPVVGMLGDQATPAERAALRLELGLDDLLPVQLARFAAGLARGDLGVSYRHGQPVAGLFAERLPATLELAGCALALTLLAGLPLGVRLGSARDGPVRGAVDAIALLGASTPTFVLGLCLILLFSVVLGWLPPFGRGPTVDVGGWPSSLLAPSGWRWLVLPTMTLGIYEAAIVARLVRTAMREAMDQPHVRFARARGLPEWRVRYGHALPLAVPAVLPLLGLQVGQLLVYTAVTETVFQWPGMGSLFVQAALFGDLPVLAGYLLYVGLVFIAVNALVDLGCHAIDPRRREPHGAAAGQPA
jgi:peptide/nickel transport system permease protein